MTWILAAVAVLAVAGAGLLLAGAWFHRRQAPTESVERILFPIRGTKLSRSALDSTLRLARVESAILVPAYLTEVPMQLSLEAPIARECRAAMPLLEAIEQRATKLKVPVDARIERGRTPRHALHELIEHEAIRPHRGAGAHEQERRLRSRRRGLVAGARARRGRGAAAGLVP